MPDFDQRRAGLPQNGNNYCVTTRFINWAGSIAAHGNPSLLPGEDWYLSSNYAAVTASGSLLGFIFNTNPSSGTNVPKGLAGGQAWLGGFGLVVHFDRGTIGDQTFAEMAQIGMNGGLVMPQVAWLENVGNDFYVRNGGHLVCMSYAARSGNDDEHPLLIPSSRLANRGLTNGQSPFDIVYAAEPLDQTAPSLVYWNDLLEQEFVLDTTTAIAYDNATDKVVLLQPGVGQLLRQHPARRRAPDHRQHPERRADRPRSRAAHHARQPGRLTRATAPRNPGRGVMI